jgi:hypothetical protein
MLWALACLVMYALCASPSTGFSVNRHSDGSPVLDAAGNLIHEVTWRSELNDAMPFLLTTSASIFFLVLAVRALVKKYPPDTKDAGAIDGGDSE